MYGNTSVQIVILEIYIVKWNGMLSRTILGNNNKCLEGMEYFIVKSNVTR